LYDGGFKYVGRLADVGQPIRKNFRLWQPGFYDFNIFTEDKLIEKLTYLHNNWVKARLVSSPDEYKWSSFVQYLGKRQSKREDHVQTL